MADATQRIYRPACLARLLIRLEDFTPDSDPAISSEAKPVKDKLAAIRFGITTTVQSLAESLATFPPDTTTANGLRRQLSGLKRTETALQAPGKAQAYQEEPGDPYSIVILSAPIEATVNLQGVNTADTANVTLPFIDAPFVSQIIRSAILEIYQGTILSQDFANPDRWGLLLNRRNVLFRGYVDDWDTQHDENNAVVQIQARGMDAVLRDAKINALAKYYRIHGDEEPITTYLNRILALLPATSGGKSANGLRAVMFRANRHKEPKLSKRLLNRSLQSAKSQNAGAAPGQPGISAGDQQGGTQVGQEPGTGQPTVAPPHLESSVWDLFLKACGICGLIPVYDPSLDPDDGQSQAGDVLLLRPPNTLYDNPDGGVSIKGGAPDLFRRSFKDPITGREISSEVRILVWGHNIKSMKTKRRLGRTHVAAVEIISYNADAPASQRLLRVRYPTKVQATRLSAKGTGKTEEIQTRYVRDIRDPDILQQIAVSLYSAISRHELVVNIQTDDMASYVDPANDDVNTNFDPDLLRLRPATPVRVTVAREVRDPKSGGLVISSLSEVFEKRTTELAKFLRDQNGRFRPNVPAGESETAIENALAKVATAIKSSRLADIFYVRSIAHHFSSEEGYDANIEVINYLEARSLPSNISAQDQQLDNLMRATLPSGSARVSVDDFAAQVVADLERRNPR